MAQQGRNHHARQTQQNAVRENPSGKSGILAKILVDPLSRGNHLPEDKPEHDSRVGLRQLRYHGTRFVFGTGCIAAR